MNKKFFTLIASVFMLAASLGTVSGEVPQITVGNAPGTVPNTNGKHNLVAITKGDFDNIIGGNPYSNYWKNSWFGKDVATSYDTNTGAGKILDDIIAGDLSKLNYVWVNKDGELKIGSADQALSMANYYESIFCVTRSQNAIAGQGPTLNIQSFSHNSLIMADPASSSPNAALTTQVANGNAVNVKVGSIGDWGYSSVYASGKVEHFMPLFVYYPVEEADGSYSLNKEVLVFALDGNGKIITRKYPASNVLRGEIGNDVLLFEFVNPAPRVLTAADFNTIMGQQTAAAHKLNFSNDVKGADIVNPWRSDLKAIDVKANNSSVNAAGKIEHSYYSFAPNTPVTQAETDRIDASKGLSLVDLPAGVKTNEWLYFQRKDDGKFLYVDTAYYDDFNELVKFAWSDTISAYWATTQRGGYDVMGSVPTQVRVDQIAYKKGGNTSKWDLENNPWIYKDSVNREFLNHYRFRVVYYWENDSLGIDVATANLKPKNAVNTANKKLIWNEYPSIAWSTPYYDNLSYHYLPGQTLGRGNIRTHNSVNLDNEIYTQNNVNAQNGDKLRVGLFGLGSEGYRVVTIGERPINTKITLGINKCGTAENNFTSVGKGVYLIKNASGKYLQVPVYRTDNKGTNLSDYAKWVSIEEKVVDPKRQPSFHWIVLKEPATDPTKASLTLKNREFPDVKFTGVRLFTDHKSEFKEFNGVDVAAGDSLEKAGFIQITGAEYLGDKYLGYYHITESDAKYSRFDLNYYSDVLAWADQPQDFFLGLSDAKGDSTTMIKKGRNTQYSFIRRWAEQDYGYQQPLKDEKVNTADPNYIPGLVMNLVRVPYVIQGPDSTHFTIDKEQRYALASILRKTNEAKSFYSRDTAVFYLKANNYAALTPNSTQKVDFYAMLDASFQVELAGPDGRYNFGATVNTSGFNDHHKLGIADDTGWSYDQPNTETRTSAFAVTQTMDPLYRRFDNLKYTYGNPLTPRDSTQEKFIGDSSRWAPLYLKFNDMLQTWMHLYENSDNDNLYRKGLKNISILGLQDPLRFPEGDAVKNSPYYQFYVDTAFVTRKPDGSLTKDYQLYTSMPQYMLAVNPTVLYKSKIWYQTGGATWMDGERNPNEWEKDEYENAISIEVDNMTVGRYLFNAKDSVNVGNKEYLGKIENNIENDILLSFVKGVHFQDTFYVLEGTELEKYVVANTATKAFDVKEAYAQAKKLQAEQALKGVLYQLSWYNKHPLNKNTHYEERFAGLTAKQYTDSLAKYRANVGTKVPAWINNGKSMVFQFRLRNVGQAGGNPNRDFYIETQKVGDVVEIGPSTAKFIKNHNGVPVISPVVSFPKDATDSQAALGFNVSQADEDVYGKPGYTSAEAAYVNDATIIGNAGSVSVLNAAGKTVTVTNVLGQTIAKTVVSSDNATIALPKGIVVVSVDGKSTKAVVK